MTTRMSFGTCGVLLLALALLGAWASWEEICPHYAWTLDDPVRIMTHSAAHERLDLTFLLHNTARARLRILGASAC
jgi:hypothetical protein